MTALLFVAIVFNVQTARFLFAIAISEKGGGGSAMMMGNSVL
jgi:hypothetical protein